MKGLFKRILAILTASMMVLGSGITAFAAEETSLESSESVVETNAQTRASNIVGFNSSNFSGTYGKVSVYLDTALWGANFSCSVNGDPGGTYSCSLTIPGQSSKFLGMVNGDGHGTDKNVLWVAYAPKGWYTFECNGTGGNCIIMGTIFD